jgi:hypothetical protein
MMIGVGVATRRNTPMLCRNQAKLPVATHPDTPDIAPDVDAWSKDQKARRFKLKFC